MDVAKTRSPEFMRELISGMAVTHQAGIDPDAGITEIMD